MNKPAPLRVLVVDDEASIGAVAHEVLGVQGLEVVHVETVEAALDALAEEPAVVIVDKNLPDGNGLDLLPFIRRQWPDSEAIVYTGFPSMESVVEAMRHGATDYLVKPLPDVSELLHRVQLALDRRQMRLDHYAPPDTASAGSATPAELARLLKEICRAAAAGLRRKHSAGSALRLRVSPLAGTVDELTARLDEKTPVDGADSLAVAAGHVRRYGGSVEVRDADGDTALVVEVPIRGT